MASGSSTERDCRACARLVCPVAKLVCINEAKIYKEILILKHRDGDDGSWSSFTIRVGTPAQDVRVFISTATEETWVVLPLGCATGDTPCPDARGQLFSPNASSTWSQQGYYQLDIERNLDVTGDGEYGNDTLGLGIQGSNGPTLKNQVIGGIATDNYYLGMFGVNPKPTNFTNDDSGQASYMTSLKDQNLIPSLSFGYTAGAPYREY